MGCFLLKDSHTTTNIHYTRTHNTSCNLLHSPPRPRRIRDTGHRFSWAGHFPRLLFRVHVRRCHRWISPRRAQGRRRLFHADSDRVPVQYHLVGSVRGSGQSPTTVRRRSTVLCRESHHALDAQKFPRYTTGVPMEGATGTLLLITIISYGRDKSYSRSKQQSTEPRL